MRHITRHISPIYSWGIRLDNYCGVEKIGKLNSTESEKMSRNALFVITIVIVSGLAAYVAHGMFAVGTMSELEKSKMYFAASVLAFLAFIFMLSIIIYALGPEPTPPATESPGKLIFDSCVKIIPPLVTLIVGFYFGATQSNIQTQPEPAAVVAPTSDSESN
ncbi:hypothetical protein D3C76_733880 [compost metagenome]